MTTALIILDGYGYTKKRYGNAVLAAYTPTMDALRKNYPFTTIEASGFAVGLPEGQMGNSEVGHLNLGAGRVVYQDITAIDKAIVDGEFFKNSAFLGAIKNCKDKDSSLHLVGLLSDGGVHSSIEHLFALLDLANVNGLKKVFIHCITDGRDVSPTSGIKFIESTEQKIAADGVGKIASVCGRYYFMDRDNRWERIEKAYKMFVNGDAERFKSSEEAIKKSYEEGITDEFVNPRVIGDYSGVEKDDSIIFFNFRSDRAREMTRALKEKNFDYFSRKKDLTDIYYVCMTQYDENFKNVYTAFPPRTLNNTLGEYLSKMGKTQTRLAETEKYAHVTFFFNGGVEKPSSGEKRVLVPSPRVATYDLQPEMSAYEVRDRALAEIEGGVDFLILNFANSDMVGHTGNFASAVKAVEVVDYCLGEVLEKLKSKNGQAIVTADHGNSEKMLEDDGSPCTSHSTNPVPLVLFSKKFKTRKLRANGCLVDVAPTLLEIAEIEKPKEMEGKSLII